MLKMLRTSDGRNAMTNEEAFQISAKHLLKQGRRATVKGNCSYRTPHGAMCAIGVLIPDDEYNPDFENMWVSNIYSKVSTLAPLDLTMLDRLQDIHDNSAPYEWRSELAEAACEFGFDEGFLAPDSVLN